MGNRVTEGPWLFAQTDYRAILREGYVRRKQKKRGFSYSVWARELGLRSPSSLNMILNGSRHPGDNLVDKLSKNLQLSASEASYFRDLVALQKDRGRDVETTVMLLERIRRRQRGRKFRFVDFETLESISNWYYVAIREMVQLGDFREDPYWICGRLHFKVTPGQVARALRQLLSLKLLGRDEDGRLVTLDTELDMGNDLRSAAIQRLHTQALDQARECLTKVDPKDRKFQLSSFVMDGKRMDECKEWIRRFHDEFCDRFEEVGGDQLYQLQMFFYPMTRRPS